MPGVHPGGDQSEPSLLPETAASKAHKVRIASPQSPHARIRGVRSGARDIIIIITLPPLFLRVLLCQ
eukprot:8878403-Pyramimonas_sp.AAC.1